MDEAMSVLSQRLIAREPLKCDNGLSRRISAGRLDLADANGDAI